MIAAYVDSSVVVAIAFYLAPEPSELSFLTLDERQRGVASALGFRV